MAAHAGEDTAANAAEKTDAGLGKHPVERPVRTNAAGIPDDWLKPPSEGGSNPFAHTGAPAAPEPTPPVHEPVPQLDHARVNQLASEPVHEPVHHRTLGGGLPTATWARAIG